MRLYTIIASAGLAITGILSVLPTIYAKQSQDDNAKNDPSPASMTGGAVSTPTYAHAMEEVIREFMDDFSHMTTNLHDTFAHPFFSHRGFRDALKSSSSKPFSTWGSFGSLARWSPRYEVIDDAKQFQVKMDVPGFHFHEMKVELEQGGRLLSISGTKETHESKGWGEEEKTAMAGEKKTEEEEGEEKFESYSSTSFQQKFTLDPSIDTSKMTANLINGVLEVRAPRKHGAWNSKHIPITQFDEDVWAELIGTKVNETGKRNSDVVEE
jgi:HSP20 family molecular chaperone IbpA